MKALFLTRGSVSDGLGHVTRSRAVARECAGRAEVRFVVIGDGCAEALVENQGFAFDLVPDEAAAASIIREWRADVTFLDLLRLDDALAREIAATSVAISLSPVFDAMQHTALVFHRTERRTAAWPTGPEYRCGLQYAVVGAHCRRVPEAVFEQHAAETPLSIAVSMGGTDAANKTIQILERLRSHARPLLIWALLGEGYAHSYQSLVDRMHGTPHEILLAKTNDSMWRILHLVSVAILAGGTTTYEAAFAGLPSIVMLEKPASFFLIEELVEKGAALCAGTTFPDALDALNPLITRLDADRAQLREMHRRAQTLVDGQGARRIVEEAVAFCQWRLGE